MVAGEEGQDLAFAVGDPPDHQFVLPAAAGFGIGVGRGEDVHVLRRAALAVVEFVEGVEPDFRDALHDRVVGVAGLDLPVVFAAVAGAEVFARRVFDEFAGLIEVGAVPHVFAAPQQADHLFVGLPAGKRVVAGVEHEGGAAFGDVGFELAPDIVGPHLAVVIDQDDVVRGEVRGPAGPGGCFGVFGGRQGDGGVQVVDVIDNVQDEPVGLLPVVVVLAGNEQDGNRTVVICLRGRVLRSGVAGGQGKQANRQQGEREGACHGGSAVGWITPPIIGNPWAKKQLFFHNHAGR